ncbi:MAG: CBS domain-containing protein [Acidobacteria bacterium]|nr:CBS domain-containing protein [Acidobacteriota bacterium]
MNCPSCSFDNIQGADDCEQCGADLRSLDIPQPGEGLQKTVLEDPLKNLMPLKPLVVAPDEPLGHAIGLMKKNNQGSVFVIEDDRLVGILTERDLLLNVAGRPLDVSRTLVRNLMIHDPATLRSSDSIAFALNRMYAGHYRHIPVVDDGKLTGFVSIRGVLRYLSERLHETHGHSDS